MRELIGKEGRDIVLVVYDCITMFNRRHEVCFLGEVGSDLTSLHVTYLRGLMGEFEGVIDR